MLRRSMSGWLVFGATLGAALTSAAPALAAPVVSRPAVSPTSSSGAASLRLLERGSAAAGEALVVRWGARGVPRYLRGTLSEARPVGIDGEAHALAFVDAHRALFGLGDVARELAIVDSRMDEVGGTHVIYRQLRGGIPVYGSVLAIHMDERGVVRSVNAQLTPGLQSQTRDLPSFEVIRAAMAQQLGARLHNSAPGERFVVTTSAASDVVAWRVPTMLTGGRRAVDPVALWVDARTGAILWGEDPIRHAEATVTGIDVNGDVQELNGFAGRNFRLEVSPILRMYVQQAEKGAYNLVDQTTLNLGRIYTWDSNETFMMKNEYVHSPDPFFDAPNDPGHPAGVSAHQHARDTLDYYWQVHGRKGLDDAGMSVASLVQISDPVPSYPLEINAGWVGYGYNFMIYGAGGEWPPESGVIWDSFSGSLDVIGHELNHGVNEFTVNLGYEHESGALNEHVADVFGVLTQAYWEGLDWLIGEDLFPDPVYPYDAVRSMEDPTLYRQPDRMSTFAAYPLSYDAGGVHFNSGIANKAFYLAVAGGTFNGVTVSPLSADIDVSLEMAERIWYDVMLNRRINPNSQLIDMREATLDAARSLHPAQVPSLEQAWTAVEVTEAFYPDPAIDTTEPNDYKGISVPIETGESVQGLLWNRGDCDIYALSATGTVNIKLSNLAYGAQLAVYKSGMFGILNQVAASNNEYNLDELINIELNDRETYYIEVMVEGADSMGSETEPYTLSILPG